MGRLLGILCFLSTLFPLAVAAAPAELCAFSEAVYEGLDDPMFKLSSEEDGRIVVRKDGKRVHGFKFVGKPGAEFLQQEYGTRSSTPVNYSFFDEKLVAAGNPTPSSPAPAYVYLSTFPDVEGPMFQRKYCKQKSSMPGNRPAISVSACPFYRAVYTNIEDPSLTIRSEKEQGFFASLKVIIKGDRTPERPYTFGFTNGSGITFIATADDGKEEASDYMFLNESLRFDGIGSAADPAPAYFFMTDMANVPGSMFRLTECKPDSSPPKPAE